PGRGAQDNRGGAERRGRDEDSPGEAA
ncbi:hypothetical protein HMPREF9719_01592, partial [Corynebacterium otitidis ATCC 51513]